MKKTIALLVELEIGATFVQTICVLREFLVTRIFNLAEEVHGTVSHSLSFLQAFPGIV